MPTTVEEAEALSWEQLKALVLAYPEIEHLPKEKRRHWLLTRWAGLSQEDRDAFREALDAADAAQLGYASV
jgi:hypothetical protein